MPKSEHEEAVNALWALNGLIQIAEESDFPLPGIQVDPSDVSLGISARDLLGRLHAAITSKIDGKPAAGKAVCRDSDRERMLKVLKHLNELRDEAAICCFELPTVYAKYENIKYGMELDDVLVMFISAIEKRLD